MGTDFEGRARICRFKDGPLCCDLSASRDLLILPVRAKNGNPLRASCQTELTSVLHPDQSRLKVVPMGLKSYHMCMLAVFGTILDGCCFYW